jgi:phosphoribosyl-AMP cyclohydrolase
MSETFPTLENKQELEEGAVLAPRFNADGLITAIAQDILTGEILMLAHMNAEALHKTISSGKAYFWSRSRQELWLKGETSGNILFVDEILTDCDQDAIVLKVELEGTAACHTGAKSCFYRKVALENGKLALKRT